MNPRPSFLSDAFFDGLSRSMLGVEAAETLPPACYTDADFYEFEKEALFNHEWLCVGRVDWVKEPGDFFTTRIIGEPIVITRNRDNEIKAMSAVCQHRAMLVAEGRAATPREPHAASTRLGRTKRAARPRRPLLSGRRRARSR